MSIAEELAKRILIIDGAMGTMIQRYIPDWRRPLWGVQGFVITHADVKGNNDLLILHALILSRYIPNNFKAENWYYWDQHFLVRNGLPFADYKMEGTDYEMSFEGAKIAKEAVNEFMVS